MLADTRPKIVIIIISRWRFQKCCVIFYSSIISYSVNNGGKNWESEILQRKLLLRRFSRYINSRGLLCLMKSYVKFFYIPLLLLSIYFSSLFFQKQRSYRSIRDYSTITFDEIESTKSNSRLVLANSPNLSRAELRSHAIWFAFRTPMQIAGVACRFRYRVQNTGLFVNLLQRTSVY